MDTIDHYVYKNYDARTIFGLAWAAILPGLCDKLWKPFGVFQTNPTKIPLKTMRDFFCFGRFRRFQIDFAEDWPLIASNCR